MTQKNWNPQKLLHKETTILFLIVLLALVLRLYRIDAPLLDRHSYRQTHTAMVARNLFRERLDIFHPKYDDGGPAGRRAGGEFPLFPLLVALGYKIFGVHEIIGKLINLFFSVGCIYVLYLLVKQYFGTRVGLFTVLFFAISPLGIYYSRTFQRYGLVLFCLICLLYFYLHWLKEEKWHFFFFAVVFANLSFLTHPPTMYIGLALIYLAYLKYKGRFFLQWKLWLFALLVLTPSILWIYYFIHTFGGGGFTMSEKRWGDLGYYFMWVNKDFFMKTMFLILGKHVLTPIGYLLFIPGLFMKDRSEGAKIFHFWLLGIYIHFALDAYHSFIVLHDYYYFQVVPVASVFIGKTLTKVWEGDFRLKKFNLIHFRRAIIVLLFLTLVGGRMATQRFYKLKWDVYQAAKTVQQLISKNDILVSATGGPELLYYADKRGWQCSSYPVIGSKKGHEAVEYFRKRGANYLVNTFSKKLDRHPEYLEYLSEHYKILVKDKAYVIYDMR